MLTNRRMTAIGWALSLLLAVFFYRPSTAQENPLTDLESSLNDLVYRLSRSVVTIDASRRIPATQAGSPGDEALESVLSSGIICDTAGRVLTAASSVIGRERILVSFENRVAHAELLAIDYQTELALLECPNLGGQPAQFSNLQACAGQMVVGLGNAYGVRAAPSIGFCAGVRDDGMMQFSVPVSSCAVGGGVFDLSGELLGIITGALGDENQVTVALPAYQLPSIVSYLVTNGDRSSGFVGISSRDIEVHPGIEIRNSAPMASTAGASLDEVIDRGVLVTTVLPMSPAHRAGLQTGDLIYEFDNIPVNSAAGLARLVRQSPPGKTIDLKVLRDNTAYGVQLKVGLKNINLISARASHRFASSGDYGDHQRVVDSLRAALAQLRQEITRLERRLDAVD